MTAPDATGSRNSAFLANGPRLACD